MIVSLPSRAELINWVNQLTEAKVEKLEQLSDGIQFCQIFDKIYPKIINLNKLKKDVKVPLEKEKNFRLLLNAIGQLDLSITINIMDLANSKVTAILELLQWLWKEHKKPTHTDGKNDGKDNKDQPRMIKSYVGSLVTRPHQSLIKGSDRSDGTKSLSSSRRSLDSRLNSLPKPDRSEVKSVKKSIQPIEQKSASMEESEGKEKKAPNFSNERKEQRENIQISQIKGFAEDQPEKVEQSNLHDDEESYKIKDQSKSKGSRTKYLIAYDKEKTDRLFEEKKEKMKNLKEEKKIASQKKDINLGLILESTFNLEREKICKKLIKVTEIAIENNPELEEKFKRLLTEDESQKSETLSQQMNQQQTPESQHRNIFLSNRSNQNSSLVCERDSYEDVQIDGPSLRIDPKMESDQNRRTVVFVVDQPEMDSTHSEKKEKVFDKKETVKKSSIKQKDQKSQNSNILSQHLIKQISAQKGKAQTLFGREQAQTMHEEDQAHTNKPQNSLIFLKNIPTSSAKNYFTEKKPEINTTVFAEKKIHQSANESVSHFGRNDVNAHQQTQNVLSHANQTTIAPFKPPDAENVRKEEESRYPDLEPYVSAGQIQKQSSSNQRFF